MPEPGAEIPTKAARPDRRVAQTYRAAGLALVVLYVALQSHLSANVGRMLFRTNDESAYLDTIVRLQQGIMNADFRHAFGGSTFAYGWGYYYVLAAVSAPMALLGLEPGFILALRLVNVVLWCGCLWTVFDLLRRQRLSREGTGPPAWWDVACLIFLCLMPGLHTVLILLKPEVLQALLLLLMVRALWRWHDEPRPKTLAVCGVLAGACVAAKISSVLFLAAPGVYFLWRIARRRDGLVSNARRGLALLGIAAGVAVLITFPIVWFEPGADGWRRVAGEYSQFAVSLRQRDIAEIDLYRALHSHADALRAWLTHPYSHGFLAWGLFYPLLGVAIAGAWREWRGAPRFPLATIAVTAHLVVAAFYLLTTAHLSVWYFFPTMVLLLPVALRELAFLARGSIGWLAPAALALLVASANNLAHSARLANDLTTARERTFDELAPRFEPVRALIRERQVPLGRIEFFINVAMDLSMDDLRFRPCDGEDLERQTPRGVSRFVAYVGLPGEFASQFDLVIVDKRHLSNTQKARNLVAAGMGLLYEDAYSLVISRNPGPRKVSAFREVTPTRWSGGSDGGRLLRWSKPEWRGLMQWWNPPADVSRFHTLVLDLKVKTPPGQPDQTPPMLRFGFRGCSGNDPKTRTQRANQWDVDLFDRLGDTSAGVDVTLRVPLSEFRASVFEVQWKYVTGAEFAGYLPAGSEVTLKSYRLE